MPAGVQQRDFREASLLQNGADAQYFSFDGIMASSDNLRKYEAIVTISLSSLTYKWHIPYVSSVEKDKIQPVFVKITLKGGKSKHNCPSYSVLRPCVWYPTNRTLAVILK